MLRDHPAELRGMQKAGELQVCNLEVWGWPSFRKRKAVTRLGDGHQLALAQV